MDFREVVQAFRAMDAYGHPYTVPRGAMISSVRDGFGFDGRIEQIASMASFVYFGDLYYARKEVLESNTKPLVFTSGRKRGAASV